MKRLILALVLLSVSCIAGRPSITHASGVYAPVPYPYTPWLIPTTPAVTACKTTNEQCSHAFVDLLNKFRAMAYPYYGQLTAGPEDAIISTAPMHYTVPLGSSYPDTDRWDADLQIARYTENYCGLHFGLGPCTIRAPATESVYYTVQANGIDRLTLSWTTP